MKLKFKVIVVVGKDEKKLKAFTLESTTWGSAIMEAHKIVQEKMRQGDFQVGYELKALIRIG